MNIIEKQTELGKSLYAINTSTMKEYMSLQRSNIENYIEVNREFGSRLPEIKSVTNAVELQREYSEMVWNQVKAAMGAQNELIKGAFNETREALKTAYTFETEVTEAIEVAVKPKAKAKPKAKKTAEAA
ncbi:MAG: hypothetical protein ACJAYE_000422 [Candidatus Azotimanducaceae bacterium]|jgi:hypothetical protein